MRRVTFKPLKTAEELKQVHRLNHKTFAEELGQYEIQESGELADRFHAGNRYFIAKCGEAVVGMISINSTSPFSIEKRLTNAAETLARFLWRKMIPRKHATAKLRRTCTERCEGWLMNRLIPSHARWGQLHDRLPRLSRCSTG